MLELIKNFQLQIFELLQSNNHKLFAVDQIYLTTPRDAKYPFIVINLTDFKNQSRFDQIVYAIDFNVVIFHRDKPQTSLIAIGDGVTKTLMKENFRVDSLVISGMKAVKMEFENSQDLVTSKLVINYLASIKQ